MMDLTERGVYKNLILCLTDKKEDVERVLTEQVLAHQQPK